MTAPSPGSQGNGTGTCISCLRFTGLRAGAEGEATWIVARLVRLGLSKDQAHAAVHGQAGGLDPDGRVTLVVPVCERCAPRAGFRTVLCIEGWDVPVVRQAEAGKS
jgi:hypothetical protein